MRMAELAAMTRTVRRFREESPLGESLLCRLVDLARLGGSASNRQPLRYMIVTDKGLRERIFPCLAWAGYLEEWPGPAEGERPPAYIVCFLDRERSGPRDKYAYVDLGIATQNLLLGAAELGIFGCRIAAFSSELEKLLRVGQRYRILLVVALGYPAEQVVLEEAAGENAIRYWRDDNGVHHVPKRRLDDILLPVGRTE